jgi:hypothetical protein
MIEVTASGDEDVLPKFPPLGEVRFRWRGVEARCTPSATMLTLFSSCPRTMQGAMNPLAVPLKAATGTFTNKAGALSTT